MIGMCSAVHMQSMCVLGVWGQYKILNVCACVASSEVGLDKHGSFIQGTVSFLCFN